MTSEQRSVTEATDSVFAELQLSTCQCWNDFHLFESIFLRSEGTKETKLTAMLVLVMTDVVHWAVLNYLHQKLTPYWFVKLSLKWQISYLKMRAKLKQDRKIICLFPLTTAQHFLSKSKVQCCPPEGAGLSYSIWVSGNAPLWPVIFTCQTKTHWHNKTSIVW